jgi:hypothetical protein
MPMMSPLEIVPYLHDRGFLTSRAVLDGLTIEDVSRRNTNVKVLRPRGMSYFVKQARDADAAEDLANEAAVYQILLAESSPGPLRRCVPQLLGYDPDENTLVLEFIRKSHSLREHHALKRRFPVALGAAVASALAGFHQLPVTDEMGLHGSSGPPWIFRLHRPGLRHRRGLSGASLQVVEIVQGSAEFCRLLDDVGRDWRSDTFIHFDAKWDNFVVVDTSAPTYARGVRVVDWELAGPGDVCWDLGSVLADYLNLWRASVLFPDGQTPAQSAGDSQRRLKRMQPAMRAFWRVYVACMRHEPALANELLARTARFAAVRLLQTAVESAQFQPDITNSIMGNVQLSLNILQSPLEAVVHLFGIRLSAPGR